MKALTLALLLCLPLPKLTPPPRAPNDHISQVTRKGGRWYFAATGHAVYCYGPVLLGGERRGGLRRVAAVCQGAKPMGPLMDGARHRQLCPGVKQAAVPARAAPSQL